MNIVAGTGHRELPYDDTFLLDIAQRALIKAKPKLVLSGMAQGWDTILAEAAVSLGIPFNAICPFKGQGSNWPEEAKKRYIELLAKAKEVIYTSDHYHKHCFFVRDRYLVDNSDILFAMWDGREKGGTFYTVKYSIESLEKRPEYKMLNLWKIAEKVKLAKHPHEDNCHCDPLTEEKRNQTT
jgi:uncharacterized phage-like protein YoqJ